MATEATGAARKATATEDETVIPEVPVAIESPPSFHLHSILQGTEEIAMGEAIVAVVIVATEATLGEEAEVLLATLVSLCLTH